MIEQNGNDIYLENELRDTAGDWFYWAFCVEDAGGQEVTFHFPQENRLGYWGAAVSHDLKEWHWSEQCDDSSFIYRFGENENKVYFAHNMLYHPDRFYEFAKRNNLQVSELCKSQKGRIVPCIGFGEGKTSVILTARHHACESTGNYVLEGVLEELIRHSLPDVKVFCVPFVDFDGVVAGDQGKNRAPLDHYMDYNPETAAHYPEVAAIRRYAAENGCTCGFDFHSPWHKGGENDTVFIVQTSAEELNKFLLFGNELKAAITPQSVQYDGETDYPPMTGWNIDGTNTFAGHMMERNECDIAFTIEIAYFGTKENQVSQKKLVELGHCFAAALKTYLSKSSRINIE